MTIIEALMIAIALGMDCFSVSVTCGIIQRRMGRQVWAMAIMFGLFQMGMTLLGWLAVEGLSSAIQSYDHWIAFVILFLLGAKMIWDGMHPKENPRFNPSRLLVILMLSIATSVDALAIGCSFVGLGLRHFKLVIIPALLIGLISFVLTLFGKYVGVKIGHRLNWPAEQIGGAILIVIGLKVLIENLSI